MIGKMFVVSTFNNLNRKMEEEMKRRQSFTQQQQPEGHVSVKNSSSSGRSSDSAGEYVDYEEVK
jgi:hypothetical protein